MDACTQNVVFLSGDTHCYNVAKIFRAWNFSREDNFSHVTVDREAAELRVRVHDKRGELVVEEDGRGGKVRLDARLGLAAW